MPFVPFPLLMPNPVPLASCQVADSVCLALMLQAHRGNLATLWGKPARKVFGRVISKRPKQARQPGSRTSAHEAKLCYECATRTNHTCPTCKLLVAAVAAAGWPPRRWLARFGDIGSPPNYARHLAEYHALAQAKKVELKRHRSRMGYSPTPDLYAEMGGRLTGM